MFSTLVWVDVTTLNLGCHIGLRFGSRRSILVTMLVLVMMLFVMPRASLDWHAISLAARARQVVGIETRIVLINTFVTFRYKVPHTGIAAMADMIVTRFRGLLIALLLLVDDIREVAPRRVLDMMMVMMHAL